MAGTPRPSGRRPRRHASGTAAASKRVRPWTGERCACYIGLARLHAAGVAHPDLDLRNLLDVGSVYAGAADDVGSVVWVIDFDRARLFEGPVPPARRDADLAGLARSATKLGLPLGEAERGVLRNRRPPDSEPRVPWMLTSLLNLTAGLGAFVTTCWALDQLRLALRSRGWPTAVAVITRSERAEKMGGEGSTYWEPRIEYAFTVGGIEFRGRRLQFGAVSGADRDEAERICRRYAVGTQVSVRFNPRDPYEAALEPGVGGEVIPPFIYAVVLAFLAWGL